MTFTAVRTEVSRLLAVALCLSVVSPCVSHGAPAAKPPDPKDVEFFEKKVRPVLVGRCQECHGPKKKRGGLRLDSRAALLKGGDTGPAVVPGTPEKSLLIQAVHYGDDLKMPPKDKLSDQEIADLTAWVRRGAAWPDAGAAPDTVRKPGTGISAADKAFWAFRPPTGAPLPPVRNTGWVKSPIDQFLLSRLEAKGLRPSPPADKRTLLRRATFDLTGLPPTPAEMEAFLADGRPDAFAQVVDRLLASPAYGERWGRHWLDVARYADSNGSSVNHAHGNAWRYRDWVVAAFNADKPYDAFVVEQLAGDLLPPDADAAVNRERLVATGFLVVGPKVLDELDGAKMEMDVVDEQVDTVGRAFLGLTLGCARCHDHKFDPVPTADYYALAGIFKSTRTLEWFGRRDEKVPRWVERPLASEERVAQAEAHQKKVTAKQAEVKEAEKKKQTERLPKLRKELLALEAAAPEVPAAMAVREGKVADARVNIRGNHLALGDVAPRGFPRILGGDKHSKLSDKSSGRLELARWLTRPDHPLTARVMVNRVWQHHFGAGLVATPDNFGKNGERPTHPELLDWLAVQFVDDVWSVKRLHREIMLSSAYQTGAAADAKAKAADPDNLLLGRRSRRRLEAEAIRDALLAVSGELDHTSGGSLMRTANRTYITGQVAKTPERYDSPRRSVYLPVVRNGLYDFFATFDFPEPSVLAGRRAVTTVPTQALYLLNSDWVAARAAAFAGRLARAGGADAERVRAAFLEAYGRPPTRAEVERTTAFLAEYRREAGRAGATDEEAARRAWQDLCQALLTANEFLYID